MSREYLENIKSENRLERIRLIQTSDPVIGGQPSDNEDEFTSNTPLLDIACTMKYAVDEIEKNKTGVDTDISAIKKSLNTKAEKSEVETALQLKANTSTNINAGDGLTGGGDLTTSRTLSLGTPSTISQNTKNSVTDSSHTHEITKATTSQQGIVQLTNTIDASQDKAITPFAVNELQKLLQEALRQAIPVGFIANWPGETAPNEDWLIMRGQKYDRAKYSELYELLKTDTLPDGRGVMLRGLDSNRGFDPGRALLSYQEDAMQKLDGSFQPRPLADANSDLIGINTGKGAFRVIFEDGAVFYNAVQPASGENKRKSSTVHFDSSYITRTNTQNETVSKNLSINIIIKVK